ncbi:peptidoglycan DD-metalloendopeptidase family protein [Rhizobium sp. G21]|uniref:peptidoglycan DD-metalloendopeptidase family protein n=1 Tax=Rhizobium sp. G21 TaxID=2758439 RepID=UPI0028B0856F|nr:peptidoglycan DD-metalloendopeptidase family protein [Rhizobium sp. G21]
MSDGASKTFGRRRQQHLLILASGEKVRHMTVRPWMTALAAAGVAFLSLGYLGATAYLVLRDDLMGAAMARQARMQHDYEDRIAALRAQVDRITSRQLLDQQVVENKVEKLLEQQMALSSRQGKIGDVLQRAEGAGLDATPPDAAPVKAFVPEEEHSSFSPLSSFKTLLSRERLAQAPEKSASLAPQPGKSDIADRADRLFTKVTLSLKSIERQQLAHIQSLAADARERADRIQSILANTGFRLPSDVASADFNADTAIGGPYMPPETGDMFEDSLSDLDLALQKFERVKSYAETLPFANPAPGREITSLFGNRIDPFFGKLAMHAGIDFRQKTGGKVFATGAGTVIAAGPAGGYGIMVEIDHGNGVTTRYGHLSRILVDKGQKIADGDIIALSGSTGRSTGPHLHYEVRRNGRAVDPLRFLNAGMKLDTYIR